MSIRSVWMVLLALLFAGNLFAQSGVSVNDRDAFLRGQMDAQQAAMTGDSLSSYCAGYASMSSGSDERALFANRLGARYPYVAYPAECQQFWTYADTYGPQFWYPRVYLGIQLNFGRTFGRWRQYDRWSRPPYVSGPMRGRAVPRGPARRR
jgi:hypothetical protein